MKITEIFKNDIIISMVILIGCMFKLKEGSQIEIEPFTSNSMQLKLNNNLY